MQINGMRLTLNVSNDFSYYLYSFIHFFLQQKKKRISLKHVTITKKTIRWEKKKNFGRSFLRLYFSLLIILVPTLTEPRIHIITNQIKEDYRQYVDVGCFKIWDSSRVSEANKKKKKLNLLSTRNHIMLGKYSKSK